MISSCEAPSAIAIPSADEVLAATPAARTRPSPPATRKSSATSGVGAPGFVFLALLTAITAPIGARLAHRLPQLTLKRAFAVLLALIALNMLREAFV